MVPTRNEKLAKTGEHFPVREKSGNFAKSGKVGEFYSKYWQNQKKMYTGKLKKNTGKVREIWKPVIMKTLQIWYHTLNKKRN